jgi:hypothetical protein
VTLQDWLKLIAQNGFPTIALVAVLWYWVTREHPRRIEQEKERDKLIADRQLESDKQHSERMQEMILHLRDVQKTWADRETALRREHAEAWEIHRIQARQDREDDREMFRRMVDQIASGYEKLKDGQDRNFVLTMAIGEKQGHNKNELLHRVEQVTGKPVRQDFDTQAPD